MTGLMALIVYSIAYLLVTLVNHSDILIDVKFIFCIVTSILLLGWLANNLSYKSNASIILLSSIICSTTLIISQYIMWLWISDFLYNQTNAIIVKIMPVLTIVDVLAMLWIAVDGLYNKSQQHSHDSDTFAGFISANFNVSKQNISSGDQCQSK